jgi:glutathione S-transferase
MKLVSIVAVLALIEYVVFVVQTGQARGRYGVAAPATTGHPVFERIFRVQQNTVEQLVIFLPALFLCAHFASETVAAALGIVFIVGRALYARGYVADPAKRGPGFLLTIASNLLLLLGGIVGVFLAFE